MPFSFGAHGRVRFRRHHRLDLPGSAMVAAERSGSMPIRRVAERHRTAGLGLPHVVDDRDAVVQHGGLQPLPGRRVEHLAGTEDALQRFDALAAERLPSPCFRRRPNAVGDVNARRANSLATIAQMKLGVCGSQRAEPQVIFAGGERGCIPCTSGRRSSRCRRWTTRRHPASARTPSGPCCGYAPGSRRACGWPALAWRWCPKSPG